MVGSPESVVSRFVNRMLAAFITVLLSHVPSMSSMSVSVIGRLDSKDDRLFSIPLGPALKGLNPTASLVWNFLFPGVTLWWGRLSFLGSSLRTGNDES